MLGKRLFQLLINLDRSEKLQLHHLCIKSTDKRHIVLKELLDARIYNTESFESVLNNAAHHFKDYIDSAKSMRRFIDFACKEIENALVENYLERRIEEKNFMLAKIFNERNAQELFSHYNEIARISAQEVNNLPMLSELSDHKTKWLSRGQMKDDMIYLRTLLREKYTYDQLNYYQQLYQYYSTISALYLDDSSVISESQFHSTIQELNDLAEKSPNLFLKAQFLLAQARLYFKNKEDLDKSLNFVQNIISELYENETQCDRITRSLLYIRLLSGIHYGGDLQNLIEMSNEVMRINKKYKYKDSVSYFLNLMMLILNKEYQLVDKLRKDLDNSYFDQTNKSYADFLDALHCFMNEKWENAIDILSNLAYAESDYVSIWSKIMFIKIQEKLGNHRLLKNLIARTIKFLKEHNKIFFTHANSSFTIKSYKTKSKMPENDSFIFFRMMRSGEFL